MKYKKGRANESTKGADISCDGLNIDIMFYLITFYSHEIHFAG